MTRAIPPAAMLADLSNKIYLRTKPNGERERTTEFEQRFKEDAAADHGVNVLKIADLHDCQAALCEWQNTVIVVYRGTDSAGEMATNLFAKLKADPVIPGVKTHRVWGKEVERLQNFWEEHDLTKEFVIFTGHSRGAADAQIHAARHNHILKTKGKRTPPAVCVSHESPRPGNRAFAQFMRNNVSHIRWAVSGDIVPLTPIPPFFWHDVQPWLFDSSKQLRRSVGLVTRCLDYPRAILAHCGVPGLASVALHSMADLAKLIEKEESFLGEGGSLIWNAL